MEISLENLYVNKLTKTKAQITIKGAGINMQKLSFLKRLILTLSLPE